MILRCVEPDLDEGQEHHGILRRDDQQPLEMLRRAFGVPARLAQFHQRKPCAAFGGGDMRINALGDRQIALGREIIFREQRAEPVTRRKRAFQMHARLRKCLPLQADHASHPGGVGQFACGFQL